MPDAAHADRFVPMPERIAAHSARVRGDRWQVEGAGGARPFLPPTLDRLIRRVALCPEPRAVPAVRHADPGALTFTAWSDFAAAFPVADVAVVVCRAPPGEDLLCGLFELTWRHRLPSVVVVTHLDVEFLLSFRRTPVDEFVSLATVARDLPGAVLRSVIVPLREHLALHVEGLAGCGPELRVALARVLRQPTSIRTVRELAAAAGVTARTLENQWKALQGGAAQMGLADLLWLIRLLEALELRGRETSLCRIAEALAVDLRSLKRAGRRHLGISLGRLAAAEAAAELLRLRRRILQRFGAPLLRAPGARRDAGDRGDRYRSGFLDRVLLAADAPARS